MANTDAAPELRQFTLPEVLIREHSWSTYYRAVDAWEIYIDHRLAGMVFADLSSTPWSAKTYHAVRTAPGGATPSQHVGSMVEALAFVVGDQS